MKNIKVKNVANPDMKNEKSKKFKPSKISSIVFLNVSIIVMIDFKFVQCNTVAKPSSYYAPFSALVSLSPL